MTYLMGVVVVFGLFPLLLAMGGMLIFVFFLIGGMVSLGGITGLIINVMYQKKTKDISHKPTSKVLNIFCIVFGIFFMLLPFILLVAGIVAK